MLIGLSQCYYYYYTFEFVHARLQPSSDVALFTFQVT